MSRLLNILIRVCTLGIRFALIFFLAKYIDVENLGLYGIFSATVAFCMTLIGFEFFTYVTRALLNAPEKDRGGMVKGHAALALALYLALVPIIGLLLWQADWPTYICVLFFVILLFEHLNQEIYRILITMSQPISASILLFLRQGSWAAALILLMTLVESSRSLFMVMVFWAATGVAAGMFGIYRFSKLRIGGWGRPIDLSWVRRGLLVAAPFLLATLAQRGIFTFDRYWLEGLGGIEVVGAYVLFFGIASALSVIIDAAIISYAYPELIKHNHSGEHQIARRKVRHMLYQTLGVIAVFSLLSWLTLPIILGWIDNPTYDRFSDLFPWIIFGMSLHVIGQVPHWALYSIGKDKPLVISNIMAFATFIVCTWAASEQFGIYSVLIGINAAFCLALIWKATAYLSYVRAEGADGAEF